MRDGKKNGHGVNAWGMAIGLMASTATTKRTATASTLGPMAADMMASGAGEKNGPTFSERFHNATTTL